MFHSVGQLQPSSALLCLLMLFWGDSESPGGTARPSRHCFSLENPHLPKPSEPWVPSSAFGSIPCPSLGRAHVGPGPPKTQNSPPAVPGWAQLQGGGFSLAGYPQCLSRCCFVTQHKLWVFRGRGSERSPRSAPAQLVILLWLLQSSFPAAREGSSINP